MRIRQTSQPLMGRRKYYIELFCITIVHKCYRAIPSASRAIPVPTVPTWHGRHGSATAFYLCPILSYRHGELQLILIDLHSVLYVPVLKAEDEEYQFDEENKLRILHASLQYFLMDPSRSKEFYIDEGKAHARSAALPAIYT